MQPAITSWYIKNQLLKTASRNRKITIDARTAYTIAKDAEIKRMCRPTRETVWIRYSDRHEWKDQSFTGKKINSLQATYPFWWWSIINVYAVIEVVLLKSRHSRNIFITKPHGQVRMSFSGVPWRIYKNLLTRWGTAGPVVPGYCHGKEMSIGLPWWCRCRVWPKMYGYTRAIAVPWCDVFR